MTQYLKTPEEYSAEEKRTLSSFIQQERSQLGEQKKKPQSTGDSEVFSGLIGFGLGAVTWVVVSAIQNHATSVLYFLVPTVAYFLIKKQIFNSKVREADDYDLRLKKCEERINAKEREVNERIAKYSQEYLAHHTQRMAINMASSEAVKAIAGQLCLLYKKEIDEADRNGYIKNIQIVMDLDISSYCVNYSFEQKGTVSPKPRKSASFSFEQFGAQNLNRAEERNGATRAISSMIQTRLLEQYISGSITPTVTIENKKQSNYSDTVTIRDDACIITFTQANENYEGERGWM